jgi:hypothetical protein
MSDVKAVYEQEPAAVILGGSNEFDDAFADAIAGEPQGTPEIEETDTDVEQEAAQEVEVPAAEPAAEAAPEPEAQTDTSEYQAELARLRAELDVLKRPPEQPAAPEPEAPPVYTAEQQAALDGFKKEWPEVATGIELMLKQAQQQIAQQIFNSLAPALNPVLDYYQVSAADTQYNAIKSQHADYDQIYDNVLQWVDKQPSYMKTAMQHVVEEGSAAEVVDMINRYKMEVGKPVSIAPPAPKVTDLPEATKKVARSLGVVSSKRSAVPQSQDPTDFDGAWAEAMNG